MLTHKWKRHEVNSSSQENETAAGVKTCKVIHKWFFFPRNFIFSPLFHYKELALWKDVYPKRLHPSRWLGFHSSVIDIVNQRRHTSDKPIGGINNKRTIAAQWVSFSLLYVHTFHLPRSPHAVIPPCLLFLRRCKQACPTFIVLFPFFTWKKAFVRHKSSVLLGCQQEKNTTSGHFWNSLWYSVYLSLLSLNKLPQ